MTEQDERITDEAYVRHMAQHSGDFATCQDDGCKAAKWVKESAMCYPKPQFDMWHEEPVEATE